MTQKDFSGGSCSRLGHCDQERSVPEVLSTPLLYKLRQVVHLFTRFSSLNYVGLSAPGRNRTSKTEDDCDEGRCVPHGRLVSGSTEEGVMIDSALRSDSVVSASLLVSGPAETLR